MLQQLYIVGQYMGAQINPLTPRSDKHVTSLTVSIRYPADR